MEDSPRRADIVVGVRGPAVLERRHSAPRLLLLLGALEVAESSGFVVFGRVLRLPS
jgi:hypothetical protein